MKPYVKQLILLGVTIVILKIVLAYFISAPSAFSDDYGFAKIARSVFYDKEFTVHDVISNRPPLYAIILSGSYIFKDMELVFFFMKFINVLISSLIIIPAWLLSREFFNEKKSFILTTLIVVLPAHFSFTYFLMAENLFYPLFLFSIYFVYKSFTEESYKWDIIAGIFIGLSYLTKINALVLPVIVAFVFLFKMFKKDYKEISKKSIMAVSFLITISPWLIRNGLIFGFNKSMILSSYDQSLENVTTSLVSSSRGEFLLVFLTWVVIYVGYLMIASGFSFFTSSFFLLRQNENKNAKILFLLIFSSALFLIFMASRTFRIGLLTYQTSIPWLAGRIIGRYVEAVIPLIFISGLLGFKYMKKTYWPYYATIPILIVSSQLVFFPLFPINNMSLAWLGASKLIMDFLIYHKFTFEPVFSNLYSVMFIIILIAIFLSVIYLQKKLSVQKLLYAFIIFFFAVNLLNFAGIYYNSYTFWYKSEQTQLGLWFNKYDPGTSTVLFDERDGCKIFKTNQTCIYNPFRGGGSATIIGFWMNDEIKVGSVENLEGIDYVVSRHKLGLPLIKETKNGIFLYKTDRGVYYD